MTGKNHGGRWLAMAGVATATWIGLAEATVPAEPTNSSPPIVMETGAITLELVCHGKAMEGTFNAVHAKMRYAHAWEAWAGSRSRMPT